MKMQKMQLNVLTSKPRTIWCSGALLMAYIDDVLSYGRLVCTNDMMDLVEVRAYDLSSPGAPLYTWTGGHLEFQDTWTFAPHHGEA